MHKQKQTKNDTRICCLSLTGVVWKLTENINSETNKGHNEIKKE